MGLLETSTSGRPGMPFSQWIQEVLCKISCEGTGRSEIPGEPLTGQQTALGPGSRARVTFEKGKIVSRTKSMDVV